MLNDSMFSVVSSTAIEELKNEIKEQLKPYRSQMEAAVYKQTFENLLLKRLREHFVCLDSVSFTFSHKKAQNAQKLECGF